MTTDPDPFRVELHCGCKPLFHLPVPMVGDWLTCLHHGRGGRVVAVDKRLTRRHPKEPK